MVLQFTPVRVLRAAMLLEKAFMSALNITALFRSVCWRHRVSLLRAIARYTLSNVVSINWVSGCAAVRSSSFGLLNAASSVYPGVLYGCRIALAGYSKVVNTFYTTSVCLFVCLCLCLSLSLSLSVSFSLSLSRSSTCLKTNNVTTFSFPLFKKKYFVSTGTPLPPPSK